VQRSLAIDSKKRALDLATTLVKNIGDPGDALILMDKLAIDA
jgi:hypothetical protein